MQAESSPSTMNMLSPDGAKRPKGALIRKVKGKAKGPVTKRRVLAAGINCENQ
jgi:hypothetical protein